MKAKKLNDNFEISPTFCMPAVAVSVCISCGILFVRKETNCIKWESAEDETCHCLNFPFPCLWRYCSFVPWISEFLLQLQALFFAFVKFGNLAGWVGRNCDNLL